MSNQKDHQLSLDFYAHAGPLTDPGKHAKLLDALPSDVARLAKIVSNLGIYDVVAKDFYDVTLSEERAADIHRRSVDTMLDAALTTNDQPLALPRTPEQRIGCRCHAFTKLLVTFLRDKGIPARARCGFAAYFAPNHYEDHWLCEYWNKEERRWVLIDAQMDDVWHKKLKIDWNILDVPRDQYLTAGEAWQLVRKGEADPRRFGISFYEGMQGLWFIAGSLVRDVAALNKMEMLPWDIWGATPRPGDTLSEEALQFYDHLAPLTDRPDDTFEALQALYISDKRLYVPETVFNNLLQTSEIVAPATAPTQTKLVCT